MTYLALKDTATTPPKWRLIGPDNTDVYVDSLAEALDALDKVVGVDNLAFVTASQEGN